MSERYPRESCYICDFDNPELLEKHHIVPRRYGGGEGENVVAVCPSCHAALEQLYDKRFYNRLEIEQGDDVKTAFRVAWAAREYMLDVLESVPQPQKAKLFHRDDFTDSIVHSGLEEIGAEAAVCDGCYRNGPYSEAGEGEVRCLRCGMVQDSGAGQQMGVDEI